MAADEIYRGTRDAPGPTEQQCGLTPEDLSQLTIIDNPPQVVLAKVVL